MLKDNLSLNDHVLMNEREREKKIEKHLMVRGHQHANWYLD